MRTLLLALLAAGGLAGVLPARTASAQVTAVFDFDSGPVHASLPLDLTANGLTGRFTGNYSIQPANTLGFTPAGFAGLCLYPNGIVQSDLDIAFSARLTDFAVLYAVDELACDNSATMRVSAYDQGAFVGTATMAAAPGSYPTAILDIASLTGFDSVVVHWDHAGFGCQDYGPIFLADNVTATYLAPVGVGPGPAPEGAAWLAAPAPSPFRARTALRYALRSAGEVRLTVHDLAGRLVRTLVRQPLSEGAHSAAWDGTDDAGRRVGPGLYCVRLEAGGLRLTRKTLLLP